MEKTKLCNICKLVKSKTEFYQQTNVKNGKSYTCERYLCKECLKKYCTIKVFLKDYPSIIKKLKTKIKQYAKRKKVYEKYLKEHYGK